LPVVAVDRAPQPAELVRQAEAMAKVQLLPVMQRQAPEAVAVAVEVAQAVAMVLTGCS